MTQPEDDQAVVAPYLMLKIARHGNTIHRLRSDIRRRSGEAGKMPEPQALAYEAADFVWAYLAANGVARVQQERFIRNRVAEAIMGVFEQTGMESTLPWAKD